ncbi:predicted protein [Nematostella vectensis]|uniref:FMN-dependent NADH-azoreductase n=1 Tax=Nematostella vectensis TaxID=45351 RepID=A7RJH4_NEMVE|nr:predicted protein [Nematostella vectensis]|eukprot:XP_001640442.1 predicted protein [Nematostella vectensis]
MAAVFKLARSRLLSITPFKFVIQFRYSSYISAFPGEVKSTDDLHQGEQRVQVLHLNSSGNDDKSWTGIASKEFLKTYLELHPGHKIRELNLWDKNLLQYDLSHVASKMRLVSGEETVGDRENLGVVEKMIKTLFSADKLVVSSPMWNYSIPYVLKQYIDCVVQPGLTFHETANGPEGLVTGRPLLLITSSGGDYTKPSMKHLDYQVPYLRDIFGLIGFTDVRHIYVKNTAHKPRNSLLWYIHTAVKEETVRI